MLRALETLENVEYSFVAHGQVVSEGSAALVKLMADPESATLVVNGCLFLNVASYRFLDFDQDAEARWRFVLHGDAATLTLIHVPDTSAEAEGSRPHLLLEEEAPDFESLILLDDEDEED
jgi:hypothetical protein